MRRLPLALLALALALALGLSAPLVAHADPEIHPVNGRCIERSWTGEAPTSDGGITHDAERPFTCDVAVVAFLDPQRHHTMVQFTTKQGKMPGVGYAGLMQAGGQMMDVQHVYLDNHPNDADGTTSACKFFFKNRHMDSIVCGGKVVDGATTKFSLITFQASAGQ